MEPGPGTRPFRQLLVFKLSAVVLYRSAIEYSVSFVPTVMATQPPGMVQVIDCASVAIGASMIAVSVGSTII